MIEIRITGYTLQECIDQINGKVAAPVTSPVVGEESVKAEEPVQAAEPTKVEEPAKEEEPVKAEEPAPVAEPVKEEKPAPVAKPEEPVKAADTTTTIDRDACFKIATEVKNVKKIGALRLILAEFGANKFSEVAESDYPALYGACQKRLAQED